jgi:hypothetical protein
MIRLSAPEGLPLPPRERYSLSRAPGDSADERRPSLRMRGREGGEGRWGSVPAHLDGGRHHFVATAALRERRVIRGRRGRQGGGCSRTHPRHRRVPPSVARALASSRARIRARELTEVSAGDFYGRGRACVSIFLSHYGRRS